MPSSEMFVRMRIVGHLRDSDPFPDGPFAKASDIGHKVLLAICVFLSRNVGVNACYAQRNA